MCVYRQVELTQYNYNELLMICKTSRVICIFHNSTSSTLTLFLSQEYAMSNDFYLLDLTLTLFLFQCFQTPRNVEAKRMHMGKLLKILNDCILAWTNYSKNIPAIHLTYHCTTRPSRNTLCYPGAGRIALFREGTTSYKISIKHAATQGLWIQSWILRISPNSSAYAYEWERKVYSIGSK